MAIRRLLDLDDRRVNVGEWDWEQFEAHKRGQTELAQTELMAFLRKQERVDCAQREAHEDAANHARRLCVVIDGFLPETECDRLQSMLNPLLNSTKSPSLHNLVINYQDMDHGSCNQETIKLLTSITERLWERLNNLDGNEAGCALLRQPPDRARVGGPRLPCAACS